MADLKIVPVTTSRQKRDFLRFPWTLYQNDPYWIPPLLGQQEELLGFRPHPFYLQASVQTFVAYDGDRPLGRIAAIVNQGHLDRYGDQRGFFGFLEFVDRVDVCRGLVGAAATWLRDQGMTCVRGPCNPSLNYECGLLVDGFDSSPFFLMTYNPPYYGDHLEACGLKKTQDLFAFWGHVEMLEQLDAKMSFIMTEATRRLNITLRPMNTRRFREEVRTFLEIYNRSLVGTWGFVPLTAAEIDRFAGGLRRLIVPEMTAVAEVEGKPVGAVFVLLDYNPRIRAINGRLFPFGFLRLLWNRRAIKRVRMISTNVIPEYQKWGVGLLLLSQLVPTIKSWGIKEAEFSWVLESNKLSRGTLEKGGAKLDKTYRLYDAVLSDLL